MKAEDLTQTDSIRELAQFWDTHDLTDFEGQLEVVTTPVFEREASVEIHLAAPEAETSRNPPSPEAFSQQIWFGNGCLKSYALLEVLNLEERPCHSKN